MAQALQAWGSLLRLHTGIFLSVLCLVTAGNDSREMVFLAAVYLYKMYVYPISCFLCVFCIVNSDLVYPRSLCV